MIQGLNAFNTIISIQCLRPSVRREVDPHSMLIYKSAKNQIVMSEVGQRNRMPQLTMHLVSDVKQMRDRTYFHVIMMNFYFWDRWAPLRFRI